MSVAGQIGENSFRASERSLGVDNPIDATQPIEMFGEGFGLGEAREFAEEVQLAGIECPPQSLQEQASEQAGENADRQEEPSATSDPAGTVERWPAAGNEAMDVRMVLQGLAPGMEDCMPSCAPRCLGSAAMVVSVSAAVRNKIA